MRAFLLPVLPSAGRLLTLLYEASGATATAREGEHFVLDTLHEASRTLLERFRLFGVRRVDRAYLFRTILNAGLSRLRQDDAAASRSSLLAHGLHAMLDLEYAQVAAVLLVPEERAQALVHTHRLEVLAQQDAIGANHPHATPSPSCEFSRDELLAQFDAALHGPELQRLERRIGDCERCRADLSFLAAWEAEQRRGLDRRALAPDQLEQLIVALVRDVGSMAPPRPRARTRRRRRLDPRWLAAGFVAASLIGWFLLFARSR